MTNLSTSVRFSRIALIWIAVLAVHFIGCHIDAAFNPWLQTAEYRWWNILTSQHYLAWLSLHQPVAFGISVLVLSFFWSAVIVWGVQSGRVKVEASS